MLSWLNELPYELRVSKRDGSLGSACSARRSLVGSRNFVDGIRADILTSLTSRSIAIFKGVTYRWHKFLGLKSLNNEIAKRFRTLSLIPDTKSEFRDTGGLGKLPGKECDIM